MRKNGTGGIQQNLKTGGSTSATLASAGNATFQFNDLMDRAPSGPLALYLTALFLTISGTLTQSGGTGTAIPRDRLPSLLIDSVDWTQSWMGSPAPKSVFSGSLLPVIEFTAGGFQYGQRQQNQITASNGAQAFSLTVRVPALNDSRGTCIRETSQLALLYQSSQLKVTLAPLATLTAFSTGATLSNMTVTLTAHLDTRPEIVLGTPMEWVLHTPVAGGPQVVIQGFGRDTALTGVRPKGGVAFLGDLSGSNGQGGVLTVSSLTDFQMQWCGQPVTTDMKAWMQQFIQLLPNDRPQWSPGTDNATASRSDDFAGFPYTVHTSAVSATIDLDNALFFPIRMGGDDMQLTDLQTAENDQTFNLTQTGGFSAGNHKILCQYARQWERDKISDFIAQVMRGGPNSLAAHVLGGQAAAEAAVKRAAATADGLGRRLYNVKHAQSPDVQTYLAHQLI